MKIMRIWFGCCLIFCVYCLCILVGLRHEATYLALGDGENEKENFQYFACANLQKVVLNRTEIDLSELRGTFHLYLYKIWLQGLENNFSRRKGFEATVLDRTSSVDNVAVFQNQVCVILTEKEELREYLWLSADAVINFVFKPCTFDFARLKNTIEKFDQLIVRNEEHPHFDCLKDNSRFWCLMNCFKSSFRFSEYFYFANESGSIYLNQRKNKTVRYHENRCFNHCKPNCKLIYLWPDHSLTERQERKEMVYAFKAKPMLGEFDFAIQLVGLVCLCLNISTRRVLSATIEFLATKNERMKCALFSMHLFLLFICMLICGWLLMHTLQNYSEQAKNPTRKETTRNLDRPESFHLVVCVPVEYILLDWDEDWLDYRLDYSFMNMAELENVTDKALNETIDYIALNYQDKLTEIAWQITPKVLFKTDTYHRYNTLNRCFQLAIYPEEPRYRMLLSISKLEIKLKHKQVTLFLLTESEEFSEQSFAYSDEELFLKRVVKRSRNCINFKVYSRLNCTNRRSCLEMCIVRSWFDDWHSLTTGTSDYRVIPHKDAFNRSEWEAAYLEEESDETSFAMVRAKCMKEISDEKPCTESWFEISAPVFQEDETKHEIDLYYNVLRAIEDEQSWHQLVFDILSIQSICFGLTVFGLLKTIVRFVRAKLRASNSRIELYPICLICLFGFGTYTYRIFDEIVNGELTYSQHYEVSNRLTVPEIVFCFQINTTLIDTNRTLTGNYLEELTGAMRADNVFRSIAYLKPKTSKWIQLEPNFSTNIFEIETFYFQLKKCFSLNLHASYDLRDFYFLKSDQVLKVKFHWPFIREAGGKIHFFTRRTNTYEFSKILKLKKFLRIADFFVSYYYSISQEVFLLVLKDKFVEIKNLFKSPLSFFGGHNDMNDVNRYLHRLLKDFNETNRKTTLNLPLRKDQFDLEVDEGAFESYVFKRKKENRWAAARSNFQREYAINYLDKNHQRYDSEDAFSEETKEDLTFGLIPFKRVIVATNQEMSYSKFILNLLNTLSFWWAFRLVDAPLYALAFRQFLGRVWLKVTSSLCVLRKKTNRVSQLNQLNQLN